jgi:hypothetical protein
VPKKLAAVIDRITRMLDEIEAGRHPGRAAVEEMLTDGYAWALSLDGECARLERGISDKAVELSEGLGEESALELSALASLLSRRRTQLAELRGLLATLKNGVREPEPKVA